MTLKLKALVWQGVRMPMLTDLKLVSCEGINSSSMAALSHCVMLEVGVFARK